MSRERDPINLFVKLLPCARVVCRPLSLSRELAFSEKEKGKKDDDKERDCPRWMEKWSLRIAREEKMQPLTEKNQPYPSHFFFVDSS